MLFKDLADSLKHKEYWLYSSWMELVLRYRMTALGPFWILVGPVLYISALTLLYGQVLNTRNAGYLVHLTIGIIFWGFINQCLAGACRILFLNRYMILNGRVRYTDYVLKLYSGNALLYMHHLIVLAGVLMFSGNPLQPTALLSLLTLPLALLCILGGSIFLAVVGARFKDISELVQSFFRIAFFITPIIWSPDLHGRSPVIEIFMYLNPFYYLLDIVRAPIAVGRIPMLEIGVVCLMTVAIWVMAYFAYNRARPYVALWL